MAVTRWSAEALAELKSLERGSTAVVARQIRQRAQRLAAEAGRQQVERLDLGEALSHYYRELQAEEEDPGDPAPGE